MDKVIRICQLMALIVLLGSASTCWAQDFRNPYKQKARDYEGHVTSYTDPGSVYEGPGNWFVGIDIGTSLSFSENVTYDNFYKTNIPSGNIVIGRTLTPKWSLRVSVGISSQVGNPSAGAVRYIPDMFSGYNFVMTVGTFDVMFNITNCFRKYNTRNWYDGYIVVGGGQLYRFYVDDKVKDWYEDIYVVDTFNHRYWTAKLGYQSAWHIMRECDLTFDLDFHATDNAYNGVEGGNRKVDFFVSARIGIVYYVPNSMKRHRFANPRRYHRYWTELN